jgi:TetR/AcrR family transcriptional repressor of nem operon
MTDLTTTPTKSGRGNDKRARLVAAARTMVHENGVEQTSLSRVAAASDVPVGNIYYYFKSKDELIAAVLDAYSDGYAMLAAAMSGHRTPKARLKALIRTLTSARERIAQHGCPIGSLCSELDKRDDDLTKKGAAVFERLITIAQEQFEQLGRRDARELAISLIASYEGVALIANTLRDPELISTEARRLERWIDAL